MAYRYKQVASGGPTDLQQVVQAEKQYIPEGGRAELRINFRYRFPGFGTMAQELRVALSKAGVVPWPDDWRIVIADPEKPIWYIRWQKGNPWAAVVIAALVAVTAFIVAWTLFHVVKPSLDVIVKDYPWLIPIMIVGGLIIYFQYQSKAGEGYGGRYG
jgi:hypothetical protein